MKQITYIILAVMLLLCGGFGYERLMADRDTDMNRKGELSDIAESVTAIPLKPINGKSLTDAHDIQKDGNDLFLICQGILYRFNRQGELVCQITQPEEIKVAGYLVHSLKKQLIVLGNVDDIYYYTFDGELLFKKKLRKDFNEEQLLSAVLYKGKIYTAERVIEKDTLHRPCVKQQVQVYDTCFQPLESHPIVEVSLTHPVLFPNLQSVRLCVSPDSGEMYAYSAPYQPEHLLRDSLFIHQTGGKEDIKDGEIPLFPVCMGSRYWMAANQDAEKTEQRYLFCWDRFENQTWQLNEGFTDDFFQTGSVAKLEPMDLYGQTYSFTKFGKSLESSFPEAADSTVVFIVEMKA